MTAKELTEAYVTALYAYADAKEAVNLDRNRKTQMARDIAGGHLIALATEATNIGLDLTDAHNAFVEANEGPE